VAAGRCIVTGDGRSGGWTPFWSVRAAQWNPPRAPARTRRRGATSRPAG